MFTISCKGFFCRFVVTNPALVVIIPPAAVSISQASEPGTASQEQNIVSKIIKKSKFFDKQGKILHIISGSDEPGNFNVGGSIWQLCPS